MNTSSWQDRTEESISLYQQGKFTEAEQGFEAALAMADGFGDSAEAIVCRCQSRHNLSVAYHANSRYDRCRTIIEEGLALCPAADDILRAVLINSRARLRAELEECLEAEADLIEAIRLARPIHPSYAAEFCSNLARVYSTVPQWHAQIKPACDQFEDLHALNEPLEIYFDDFSSWRRPGPGWDQRGEANPESLQARIILLRASYRYISKAEARSDFEAVLKLDEETRAVPPHIVISAVLSLAEIAFQNGNYAGAEQYSDQAQKIASASYLRDHPANFIYMLKGGSYSVLSKTPQKSLAIFEKVIAEARRVFGPDNTTEARCMLGHALLLPVLQPTLPDMARAQEEELRKCLKILSAHYSSKHTGVVGARLFIIDILLKTNRLAEADRELEEIIPLAIESINGLEMETRCLKILSEIRIKQRRMTEARACILRHEQLLEEIPHQPLELKINTWTIIINQLTECDAYDEAERLARKAMEVAGQSHSELAHRSKLQLASLLFKSGRQKEAGELLNKPEIVADGEAPNPRLDLLNLSRQAWGMHAAGRLDSARELADRVLQQAPASLPESEDALVIAVSILIEQAKHAGKADDIMFLIGKLADCQSSLRVRCIMPSFYMEAAQAFARQNSVKAVGLFEQSVQAAENVSAMSPPILDASYAAYLTYCMTTRKKEKALELCERLLTMREETVGADSTKYAEILSSRAALLIDSDLAGAESASRQAVEIFDSHEKFEDHELFITLSTRAAVLRKQMRFDEVKELEVRMEGLRGKISEQLKKTQAEAADREKADLQDSGDSKDSGDSGDSPRD